MDVLILHGIGAAPGAHWQSWLGARLSELGHRVLMPTLERADHPDRAQWLATLHGELGNVVTRNLVIVGHSLGVTTALDYIEQLDESVGCLVSVSGFGRDYGSDLNSYFLKSNTIDFARVRRHLSGAHVVYGDDDPFVPQSALRQLALDLGVEPVVVQQGGHLNTDAGFTTFPLLLEIINEHVATA